MQSWSRLTPLWPYAAPPAQGEQITSSKEFETVDGKCTNFQQQALSYLCHVRTCTRGMDFAYPCEWILLPTLQWHEISMQAFAACNIAGLIINTCISNKQ